MTQLRNLSLLALTLLAVVVPAASASGDSIVFGGPVRTGNAEGLTVTLSGFSVKVQTSDEASKSAKKVVASKRGKIVCRMKNNGNSQTRRSSRPKKRTADSARWRFKRPLMTVGEGDCRLISRAGKTVATVPFENNEVVE